MAYTLKDQQTTNNDYWGLGSASGKINLGCQFLAGSSYTLTRVDCFLAKNGSPTFTLTAKLYSDSANKPSSLLATSTTTINAADLGAAAWIEFDFAGYALTNGVLYHIVLTASAYQDTSNDVYWQANSAATGLYVTQGTATPTWSALQSNEQFDFKTYLTISAYTMSYDGNGNTGGTAPTDGSSPYAANASVTVLGNTGSLVKTGYTFSHWNTAANGSGTSYNPADTFNINANTTLYAIWTANGGFLNRNYFWEE